MPDQTPEALAKWHDERADAHERTSETVATSLAYGWRSHAANHRATAALLREQAAELTELRAVVERLPKTVDGVSIHEVDCAWTVEGRQVWLCEIFVADDPDSYDPETGHCEPDMGVLYGPRVVYSTRAAALAAKEASRG